MILRNNYIFRVTIASKLSLLYSPFTINKEIKLFLSPSNQVQLWHKIYIEQRRSINGKCSIITRTKSRLLFNVELGGCIKPCKEIIKYRVLLLTSRRVKDIEIMYSWSHFVVSVITIDSVWIKCIHIFYVFRFNLSYFCIFFLKKTKRKVCTKNNF